MTQRLVPLILVLILVVLHTQLWFGRGSVPNVAALREKLLQQTAANAAVQLQIDQLQSEIEDLRAGLGMVEEKARMELGMVRPNEIFVQLPPH
ncbi:MAG: septum formation initiator family protein [Burkholderiaceae bacterium]|jgi:cell division protein FtsB|nr:septum formation initiator family protein [Burkholderiaceae bacterium]